VEDTKTEPTPQEVGQGLTLSYINVQLFVEAIAIKVVQPSYKFVQKWLFLQKLISFTFEYLIFRFL
jgi:hypothetical protein